MPRANKDRPLLLDTHIWIWLLNGDEPLRSSAALFHIEEAVPPALIRVSAISVWEIGMLESKGRISLPTSCETWVDQALAAPGIDLVPLSPEIALASSRLPGEFHGDPADRMLVATARVLDADLVTKDQKIVEYGKSGFVSVLDIL